MDGGAWWAADYGVTQSRTRLKRLKQQQQQVVLVVKNLTANAVSLPGESHGRRSLVSYSPWGRRVGHDCATSLHFTSMYDIVIIVNSTALYRRRQWHPTPVLLPGKPHGRRSWKAEVHGVAEGWTRLSDFTFTFHFHALEKEMATHSSVLCLENPRDRGAYWAAVYGVAQSWTQLK